MCKAVCHRQSHTAHKAGVKQECDKCFTAGAQCVVADEYVALNCAVKCVDDYKLCRQGLYFRLGVVQIRHKQRCCRYKHRQFQTYLNADFKQACCVILSLFFSVCSQFVAYNNRCGNAHCQKHAVEEIAHCV